MCLFDNCSIDWTYSDFQFVEPKLIQSTYDWNSLTILLVVLFDRDEDCVICKEGSF